MTDTKADEVIASCSFCCKASMEVSTLVAGPGVFICDECVSLCREIIANKPQSVERIHTWESADLDTIIATLPKVAAAGTRANQTLARLVTHARNMGATWARIGTALGTTRQAAWGPVLRRGIDDHDAARRGARYVARASREFQA